MGKLFNFDNTKPTAMKKLAFFSLVILVFASGCREIAGRRIRGSGNVTTQSRNVSDFRNVEVGGAIDVYLKQDSAASVKIETDDNLLEYIEIQTEGSTLRIHTSRGVNLRPSNKIKVYVSNRSFAELEAGGACNFYSENQLTSNETISVNLSGASEGKLELDAPRVSVDISGASNISLRGKTRDLDAGATGASEIRGFDLLSENADVQLSGASGAEIYASVKIEGSVSGASNVRYKGNASTSISTSGASGVNKVN